MAVAILETPHGLIDGDEFLHLLIVAKFRMEASHLRARRTDWAV
jgi:hypothetical protein